MSQTADETKLKKAAYEGDLDGVNAAIAAGANVETKDGVRGRTISARAPPPPASPPARTRSRPLHASPFHRRPLPAPPSRPALSLPTARCGAGSAPQNGYTPLHEACFGGHTEVAALLIGTHGANVEAVENVRPRGGRGGGGGGGGVGRAGAGRGCRPLPRLVDCALVRAQRLAKNSEVALLGRSPLGGRAARADASQAGVGCCRAQPPRRAAPHLP